MVSLLPEYVADIRFHIFPYQKLKVSAKNEEEARKIAVSYAEDIISNLNFTIKRLKKRQVLIEDFL